MNAISNNAVSMSQPAKWPALRAETWAEFTKLRRDPSFVLPTFGFPIFFFLIFGLLLPFARTPEVKLATLANFAAIGLIAGAMFAAGLPLANEREQGGYALKRVSPLPLVSYLIAKLIAGATLGLLAALAVFVLGMVSYQYVPSMPQLLNFMVAAAFSALVFASYGLWIGSTFSSKATPMMINLIFMPTGFLGGLMMPLNVLPTLVQQAAHWIPGYHSGVALRASLGVQSVQFNQLAFGTILLLLSAVLALMLAKRNLQRALV